MNNFAINEKRNQVKSFTSIFDIFAPQPFQDVYQLYSLKKKVHNSQAACSDMDKRKSNIHKSALFKEMPYVTSENYHALNKNSSDKSIVRSTSTLFYDLDKLVKRHSYHCVTELTALNYNTGKVVNGKSNKNVFGGKSETIIQKCATQIQPNLQMRDSFQVNLKKVKKKHLNHPQLSSEIFLNDNNDTKCNADHFVKYKDRQQKFWSFAKYQTEYSNQIQKDKKCKKKDRGKRTEDPCPCQLFSYACPCTDKKSLTELAKNSKSLTVADQITSTAKFTTAGIKCDKNNKLKNSKCNQNHDNKLINTDVTEPMDTNKETIVSEETDAKLTKTYSLVVNSTKINLKTRKKPKQIVCPNCKEKLEIISTTEEEDFLKSKNSPVYQNINLKENTNKTNNDDNMDICSHNPPCELIPVCQILPTENTYANSKYIENVSNTKHNPKLIRITKACRHHPPCTVVPSCQRVNVLKNNCEYIPPCLHRPRCVNLPLCVPFSKNFYYDEILNKPTDEIDSADYNPQYRYMSTHQEDSLNSSVDHKFHTTQNTCEYFSEYSPKFAINPKMPYMVPTFSPSLLTPMPCQCCKANKSCQYDCVDCTCIPHKDIKKRESNDAVVFIRDVGCQFRNKSFSPQESLLYSKTSSTSFNYNTRNKLGNFYTKFETLRFEDKYTNPISGEELSMSTFTTSSLEIDAHCPSHGKRYSDFSPKSTASPLIAFTTYTNPSLPFNICMSKHITQESRKSNKINAYPQLKTCTSKYRSNFIKGKRKKIFTIRRRRKSKNKARHGSQSSSQAGIL